MKKLLGILLLTGATFLTGCGSSNDGLNEISGQQGDPFAISAPVCADDAYATNSNTALTVNAANGVLANDSPAGGTLVLQTASSQGGTVVDNGQGSFTYTPAANFVGNDSFTYSVTNAAGTVTCTVNITVNAVNGFFVDAINGDNATGSFTNGLPFQTVGAALNAAPAGSDIVVRPGTYNESVTLDNGDRLLGSGSALVNAQGAVRPTFTGQIVLGDGNTVDFVRIDGFAGSAIVGTNIDSGTVTNCEAQNLTNFGLGFRVTSATGNWTVSDNNFSNNASGGIQATSDTGDIFVGVFDNNTLTGNGSGSFGFTAGQDATMTVRVTNNIMTGTVNTGATFQVIVGGTANFCADITGNTNDDAYEFSNDNVAADLRVEQFGQLTSINNGTATVEIGLGSAENPIDVPDGTCTF